jgi:hypothetical protein
MIDKMYLKTAIEHLESERAVHDEKFAQNAAHKNCLPNFDRAIDKLKQELAKLEELQAGTSAENQA